jgi:hypothetical protein
VQSNAMPQTTMRANERIRHLEKDEQSHGGLVRLSRAGASVQAR